MKSNSTLDSGLVRLEKQIAHKGLASRREAKALITNGNVSVNGVIVYETGYGVDPDRDTIEIVGNRENKKTVVLYKPRGIETSKTSATSRDIHDEFPALAALSPVGRLDKESEGLIILTNDGLVTRVVTGERSEIEKEYLVTVREQVTSDAMEKMARGIMLDEQKTLPAKTKIINDHEFSIVLIEGRKHQIRRMCDACNLTVEKLFRIRIAAITLGTLKSGQWIELTDDEVAELKKSVTM